MIAQVNGLHQLFIRLKICPSFTFIDIFMCSVVIYISCLVCFMDVILIDLLLCGSSFVRGKDLFPFSLLESRGGRAKYMLF